MKVEELIGKMKSQGLAILLISHNFEQVLKLSDHIWVMRQGDVIAGMRTKDTTGDELVALITGSAKRG
jgi:ABC-type sugar transport system ATPase subunit